MNPAGQFGYFAGVSAQFGVVSGSLRSVLCVGISRMSPQVIYTKLLQDDEMRAHLERNDTLLFKGLAREWQRIERQVERLGFGELYIVSQRGTPHGNTKVSRLRA